VTTRFINKLDALVPLSDKAMHALARAMGETETFGARCDVIREGDRPGPLLIVLEGWACRYKILPSGARQILAFILPGDSCDLHGDFFAEMDHSIQTITPCLVTKIERQSVDIIFDDHPCVLKAIYISQLVEEAALRAWITSIGRRSSTERVAHLLCELYLRAHGIAGGSDEACTLPVSQVVLADALGMTPVHINRVLKQLRVAEAITIARGSLVIVNPLTLGRIAGFDGNYLRRRSHSRI
jgi:CRP-like cAMP-binding protein